MSKKPTEVDYAEEGRKLIASELSARSQTAPDDEDAIDEIRKFYLGRVNLLDLLTKPAARYAIANAIYKHPESGATLYVGNYQAASNMQILDNTLQRCRRIVFCQSLDGKMHFKDNPEFAYLPFNIGRWRTLVESRSPECVATFFQPLFAFLDNELQRGNSILIHCLAGAHRAGTAGIASLMHLCSFDAAEATTAAQLLRPAINPIGDFPTLLALLEEGMKK